MGLVSALLSFVAFAYFSDAIQTATAIDGSNFIQRNNHNGLSTCPCVNADGSDQCQPYDPHYQAATLEEAILSFSDLSLDPRLADRSSFTDSACQSFECQQCAGALISKFRKIGLLSKTQRLALNVPDIPEYESQCKQFRFLKPPEKPLESPVAAPSFIEETIREGEVYWRNFGNGRARGRRAAEEQIIGTRTIMEGSCVEKGHADDHDGSNKASLNLCPGCWAVRTLPEGYFPPFINEFICKNDEEYDTYCMSGSTSECWCTMPTAFSSQTRPILPLTQSHS